MAITYHGVMPFGRNEYGGLVPLELVETSSAEQADLPIVRIGSTPFVGDRVTCDVEPTEQRR